MVLKTKTYKGYRITECERAKGEHTGNWIIQDYRLGMAVFDQDCAHYRSVQEAKDAINEGLAWAASPQAQ